MADCLAAVYEGIPGEISLRRLSIPAVGLEQILVRVLACTICGNDLDSFHGRRIVPVSTVLGHEIVGEIVRFGDLAPRIDFAGQTLCEGDRITWAIVANCGCCVFCRQHLPQKCLRGIKYGHERFRPGHAAL